MGCKRCGRSDADLDLVGHGTQCWGYPEELAPRSAPSGAAPAETPKPELDNSLALLTKAATELNAYARQAVSESARERREALADICLWARSRLSRPSPDPALAPVRALEDYIEDDWPAPMRNLLDRCEANVIRFSNGDMSTALDEYERLRKMVAAALEGAATPTKEG